MKISNRPKDIKISKILKILIQVRNENFVNIEEGKEIVENYRKGNNISSYTKYHVLNLIYMFVVGE